MNIQALQHRAIELWKKDKASARELGRALIAVRGAMQRHGGFAAWWHSKGMDENRVYYAIRVAEGKVIAKKAHRSKNPKVKIGIEPALWKRFRHVCGGKNDRMRYWASQLIGAWCDAAKPGIFPDPKAIVVALRGKKAA